MQGPDVSYNEHEVMVTATTTAIVTSFNSDGAFIMKARNVKHPELICEIASKSSQLTASERVLLKHLIDELENR